VVSFMVPAPFFVVLAFIPKGKIAEPRHPVKHYFGDFFGFLPAPSAPWAVTR